MTMHSLLKSTVLALTGAALLLAVACKKSNQSTQPSTFSATVHDTAFNTSIVTTVVGTSQIGLQLTAYSPQPNGDTTIVRITENAPLQVNVPYNDVNGALYVDYIDTKNSFGYGLDFSHGPGAIVTLTSIDSVHHRITGTVSGSLYLENPNVVNTDSIVVSNGQFNVSYTPL